MSQSEPSFPPIVRSVFHPSDFGTASELAFAHALAIAVLRKAPLAILHSGQEHIGEDEWTRFPAVRATLERWGLLAEGSERMDVEARLGVRVQKIDSPRRNPLAAILDYLAKRPTDLMVLATGRRGGRCVVRWQNALPGVPRPSRSSCRRACGGSSRPRTVACICVGSCCRSTANRVRSSPCVLQ
jgi:hypothetical protein